MEHEAYHIPVNYTDAGRLLGLFEIRNAVEAALFGAPLLFLCARFLPLALTAKIIVTLIILVPVSGFALIGVNDDSFTRYLRIWLYWLRHRAVLTYRGEVARRGPERAHFWW